MKRVWVTRDEDERGRLSEALRAVDLEPVVEPVLTTTVISDARGEIERLGPEDWLVLTSPRAIDVVAAEPARVPNVAVVGEESRRAAEARGMRVALVSPTGEGRGLWEALRPRAIGRRICFPRSALARLPQDDALRIDAPVIYRPEPRAFDTAVIERVDLVAFLSPSAVDAAFGALGYVPEPAASIGARTAETIQRYGVRPAVESAEPSFAALARAIAEWTRC